MKEADLRRPNTVQFQLYEVLEKISLGDSGKICDIQGLERMEWCIGATQKLFKSVKLFLWYYNFGYTSLYICQIQ